MELTVAFEMTIEVTAMRKVRYSKLLQEVQRLPKEAYWHTLD